MQVETQLYTAVHALQQIEAGAKQHSTTTLAAIAEEALEQIETKRSQYDSREEFERWIYAPPYERGINKYPYDHQREAWPGQYEDLAVQLAWEAWKAAKGEHQ